MCECKTDIEKKLLTQFQERAPEAKEHSATLGGYGLAIQGNTVIAIPCMPINLEASYLVKKTGEWKRKKPTQRMVFSFCPFCGESLKAKKDAP